VSETSGPEVNQSLPVLYCITFRSKCDGCITGWYTGSNSRWSTDHTRKKLFDHKEDAEPIAMALRELCPHNADVINIEPTNIAPEDRNGDYSFRFSRSSPTSRAQARSLRTTCSGKGPIRRISLFTGLRLI
jgi:hypothetical protein